MSSRTFSSGQIAPVYDLLTGPLEKRVLGRWRRRFWSQVPPDGLGLEVGTGTGANFRYHPEGAWVVGTDLSPAMLRSARQKPAGRSTPLTACDVERLPFRSSTFDWVAETLVFCEVADPLGGLAEIRRILRPGGLLVMLEHVRPSGWLGRVADVATMLSAPLWGEHFDRDAASFVRAAGFEIERSEYLWRDAVVLLVARPR